MGKGWRIRRVRPSQQSISYGILAVTVACGACGPVPVIPLQDQSNGLSDVTQNACPSRDRRWEETLGDRSRVHTCNVDIRLYIICQMTLEYFLCWEEIMCVFAYRDQVKHGEGPDSQASPQEPVSKTERNGVFDRCGWRLECRPTWTD